MKPAGAWVAVVVVKTWQGNDFAENFVEVGGICTLYVFRITADLEPWRPLYLCFFFVVFVSSL